MVYKGLITCLYNLFMLTVQCVRILFILTVQSVHTYSHCTNLNMLYVRSMSYPSGEYKLVHKGLIECGSQTTMRGKAN